MFPFQTVGKYFYIIGTKRDCKEVDHAQIVEHLGQQVHVLAIVILD